MNKHASPRSWGGFGKSAPLLTPISVRLSIQFLHDSIPSVAVCACIVPHGIMQHPVLLGRDSWMRFEQRTYTTLPRLPSRPLFGELSLNTPYNDGLSTFIHDNCPSPDTLHLDFADVHAVSVSATLSLFQTNLVRSSSIPAPTG